MSVESLLVEAVVTSTDLQHTKCGNIILRSFQLPLDKVHDVIMFCDVLFVLYVFVEAGKHQ